MEPSSNNSNNETEGLLSNNNNHKPLPPSDHQVNPGQDPKTIAQMSIDTLLFLFAFLMTVPGMVNAFCALSDGSPSTLKKDVENMATWMLAASIFIAFASGSINTLMNRSFLTQAKVKLDNSLKPIREGKNLTKEISKLVIYIALASFAGLAAAAMSWDAFEEVPEPARTPLRISFSLLNFANVALTRFTGLPGLIDSLEKKYKATKTKQDIANFILAILAAATVFTLFTESGFKGVNILASKIPNNPDGLTHLSSFYKILVGLPAGLVSSAFYANNLLKFLPVSMDTLEHLKIHKGYAAPLVFLIAFAGLSGALLANVNSNIEHNDNIANPNGNIFNLKPNAFGKSLTVAIFAFATMVNIKVVAEKHIEDDPVFIPKAVQTMKRVASMPNMSRVSSFFTTPTQTRKNMQTKTISPV